MRGQTPKPVRNELSRSIKDPETRLDFYASLRETGEMLQSCRDLNIPYQSVIDKKASDPEFKKAVEFAQQQGKAALHLGIAERLRKIAMGELSDVEHRDSIKAAEVIFKKDEIGGFGKTVLEHKGSVSFEPRLLAIRKDSKQ